MDIIDINNIDFDELEMIYDVLSNESTLYYNNNFLYKFYDYLPRNILERKEKKLFLLNDGEKIPNVVIPSALIKNNDLLYGCIMKYIKNSKSLVQYKNSNCFIMFLYEISLTLKKIHKDPRNIVVGDLHFNNILIDKKGQHHFIDFDSCMIDGISQDSIPNSLVRYAGVRDDFDFEISPETDRLCMLLSAINSLLDKNIDSFSMYEYDKKAEKIQTLKNMRSIVLKVKNNSGGIPDVPYLSDVISINDFPAMRTIRTKKL